MDSPLREGENIAFTLSEETSNFSPANLDMNVLVSQLQTIDQIVDRDSGQVLAAAPDHFGITKVMDENGILLFDTRMRARRQDDLEAEARAEMQSMRQQAGNVLEVHVDDDLLGAATIDSSPEKWRRLTESFKGNGSE